MGRKPVLSIISKIYQLYEHVGQEILSLAPDKLKILCEKHFDESTNCFTITIEIIVLNKLNDSDYGIVFSTNTQANSHHGLNGRQFSHGLYLMSDLSFGDGEILEELDEINYLPFSEENNKQVWDAVKDFTSSKIDDVKKVLRNKYSVSD